MDVITCPSSEHMTSCHPHQSLSTKVSPMGLHETLAIGVSGSCKEVGGGGHRSVVQRGCMTENSKLKDVFAAELLKR